MWARDDRSPPGGREVPGEAAGPGASAALQGEAQAQRGVVGVRPPEGEGQQEGQRMKEATLLEVSDPAPFTAMPVSRPGMQHRVQVPRHYSELLHHQPGHHN